jgi:phosphate-selective porin
MPQQYPPPPPRKRNWIRRHPLWSALIALILVSCIYGAINDATTRGKTATTDNASASPTAATAMQQATPTKAATPTPTPKLTTAQKIEAQTLQLAKDNSIGGKDITSRYDTGARDVTITEFTDGGFSNSGTVDIIKQICFDVQKAIWQTKSLHLSSVEIHVTGTLRDQYGHTSTGLIGSCTLDSGTAQKFAWDNLSSSSAWDVYDLTYLLPSLNS